MNNCEKCNYWKPFGHSARGSCDKLMKSFGLEVYLDSSGMGGCVVDRIITRADFGCTEFSHKKFVDE